MEFASFADYWIASYGKDGRSPAGWKDRAELPDLCGAGPWTFRQNSREPSWRWSADPAAEGVQSLPCAPVRVLHAGIPDGARRHRGDPGLLAPTVRSAALPTITNTLTSGAGPTSDFGNNEWDVWCHSASGRGEGSKAFRTMEPKFPRLQRRAAHFERD